MQALAAVAPDAPVVGAHMPGAQSLVKRVRQISGVVLRVLRKERYLKVRGEGALFSRGGGVGGNGSARAARACTRKER